MKLNNRGWGIQAMMVMTLILMLCLIFVGVMIQRNFGTIIKTPNSNDKEETQQLTYKDIEEEIKKASIEYQKTNYSDMLDGEKITVTLTMLENKGLITKVYDIKDSSIKCKGYGLFYKKNDKIDYEGYLSCGEYKTENYSEIYE